MSDPRATVIDGGFIQRCYEIADEAVRDGNHPFGALLVCGSEVIAEARNTVDTDNDITRHAELSLVSQAYRLLESEALHRSVLYASTEPCLMCAGAIHWAGIGRVVFGVEAPDVAKARDEPYRGLRLRDAVAALDSDIRVVGPVLPDDGIRQHNEFWPQHLDG